MAESERQEALEIVKSHVDSKLPSGREWLSMPELPTPDELMRDLGSGGTAEILKSLPRNNIEKPYASKDQYLQTHYRLQREEGITNLRYSVNLFRQDPQMFDSGSTCVYTKVFVLGYLMTRLGPVARIRFSTERAGKKIKWTHTRRLTPGTVVALSTAGDNFQTVCKPAIVADQCEQDGGRCTILLHWAQLTQAVIDPNMELVMVESRTGFFEAQRHSMVGLQHVAAADSPLMKYLVHGSRVDGSPAYVVHNPRMDISPLLHRGYDQRERAKYENYDVLDGISSDVGQYTSLDNSQLEAVHRILTKELAIVQGPPGTGKTFTSVQALRILLESGKHDDVIVVAAETNHAVDQILTHLINHSYTIVRLGGRTRDEEIKKYSMFNLRKRRKGHRAPGMDYGRAESEFRASVRGFELMIKEAFPEGLLDPEVLFDHGIISKEQFDSLLEESWENVPGVDRPGSIMDEWLGDALLDIPSRRDGDPVFDFDESEDDYDLNEEEMGLDLDDFSPDDIDEEHRLQGPWIGISRKWGGKKGNWKMSDLQVKRQLRKTNLWAIEQKYRGVIYEHWQQMLLEKRSNDVSDLLDANVRAVKNLKIHRWYMDNQIIKGSGTRIIGCTTTGLGKYRGLLASLKPRTILIEEAAQSREANITSGIVKGLQQLILVGDHQQLPPHCDTLGLAESPYNLRVSMFERLVHHRKLPFTMLNMQRRMIPSIRQVLTPFYRDLMDHPIVKNESNRPPVPGMPFPSYLFHHDWQEGTDLESLSKYNIMEAQMIAHFVKYLVLNGTPINKITVLTFYRGQRKKILQRGNAALGVLGMGQLNVSTIDSYQGEENDIIILSLVRSSRPNMPGRAGFVEDKNRGVVAISRARRGFFVFGNIANLVNATYKSAFMWGSVRDVFKAQGRFDMMRGLPLRCTNHGNIIYIDEPEDWTSNHGGCHLPCGGKFEDCGHNCNRMCHPMPHSNLICQAPCERKLRCGHGCQKCCGDPCHCDCDNFAGTRAHGYASLSHSLLDDGPPIMPGMGGMPVLPLLPYNGEAFSNGRYIYGGGYDGYDGAGPAPGPGRWANYDATRDDAVLREQNILERQPPPLLIEYDGAQQPLVTQINDEFRQVTIGQSGDRRVDRKVNEKSNSTSPATAQGKSRNGTPTIRQGQQPTGGQRSGSPRLCQSSEPRAAPLNVAGPLAVRDRQSPAAVSNTRRTTPVQSSTSVHVPYTAQKRGDHSRTSTPSSQVRMTHSTNGPVCRPSSGQSTPTLPQPRSGLGIVSNNQQGTRGNSRGNNRGGSRQAGRQAGGNMRGSTRGNTSNPSGNRNPSANLGVNTSGNIRGNMNNVFPSHGHPYATYLYQAAPAVAPRAPGMFHPQPMRAFMGQNALSDVASVSRGEWEKESTVDPREDAGVENEDDDTPDLIDLSF